MTARSGSVFLGDPVPERGAEAVWHGGDPVVSEHLGWDVNRENATDHNFIKNMYSSAHR